MVHLAQAAELAGVDLIFSACSSLGPSMDIARNLVHVPIVKIDDAMAEKAVQLGTCIGALATVPTTLPPTVALIEEHATKEGKTVTVLPRLCEGAFDVLMAGERDEHDQMVLNGAQSLASQVDILVLAQASMSRLAPMLSDSTGLQVLSSPRLAVEYVRDLLGQIPQSSSGS
jgi:Asp/Glu/hydantoin racemase